MKKLSSYLISLLTSIIYSGASAQDAIPEFGKIDKADLLLQECPFEKGANAMNLIKTEDVFFNSNPFDALVKTTTEYRTRIKIFAESGFKYASIDIPWSSNSHSVKITDVEAYIYNLDSSGNVTAEKVEKNQVFKEKSKSGKSHNSVRFTFPGLKKGSVIEYRYKRIDRNSLYIAPWIFQDELPTLFSKSTVKLEGFVTLNCHFVATLPVEKDSLDKKYANVKFNEYMRSFAMRNVPAFRAEPFMSSFKDNLQRVEFAIKPKSIFRFGGVETEWNLYNNMLAGDPYFGKQLDKNIDSAQAFIDSFTAIKQKADIIKAVYGFVKKRITWNGEQSFYPADLDECWKDKTGNSAEMNILLVNLLRKAGVICYPILVSTRQNGKLDQSFPSLGQFDGVDVLAIDSNTVYLLDCTQKNLSFKTTPFDILNRQALIIDWGKSRWIKIADNRPLMQTSLDVAAVMDSAGIMKGTGKMVYTGIAKAETIKDEKQEEKNHEDSKDLSGDANPELKIDSVTTEHENDDSDTLLHRITFHSELSSTGDIYFLNPFMFSMFKKNPFKDTARHADIDFGSNQLYATRIHVVIPGNFSIEDVPKSVLIRLEDSSVMFKREILSAGNQVLIRNTFTINRPLFASDEYPGLKSFFDKVYGLINEQIVLKKN